MPALTKTITVRVLQRHIDEGYRRCHDEKMDSCYNDPIALALQELTGEECSVGFASFRIGKGEMIPQTPQMLEWRKMFDKSWILGVEEHPLPFPNEFQVEV